MHVLVTGANGFVGTALTQALRSAGMTVTPAVRNPAPGHVAVGNIDGATDWSEALAGCDAVVHVAGRARTAAVDTPEEIELHRQINTLGTLNLARQAARRGIRRFIFMSSVKAMGEAGHFSPKDPCRPVHAYGRSKLEAEQGLAELAASGAIDPVVIRPPLVYGPGVKGNFRTMLDTVARGMPMPLGLVRNQRSLLYLGNLADFVAFCLKARGAVGGTWLPSDGHAVSTPELLREIGQALGVKARLLPVPPAAIRLAAGVLGRSGAADRLLGSLAVDRAMLHDKLGWDPRFNLEEGLSETARWYRSLN